jgi:two-component system chemotaxis response regulator CheB
MRELSGHADEAERAPIRVVVCDDSPFMQRLVASSLRSHDVVAVVDSAEDAISVCRSLMPDVLTLDLELGAEDGLAVLRAIRDLPIQVLVISGFTTDARSQRTRDALANGAVACIGKPALGENVGDFSSKIARAVQELGSTVTHSQEVAGANTVEAVEQVFILGASTGGPSVLRTILGSLPKDFPAPILVVQHLPEPLSAAFVTRLSDVCALEVRIASEPIEPRPGTVIVAQGGKHLRVSDRTVHAAAGEPVNGHIPSIDVTLVDAAAAWGSGVRAAILTGMGKDGADGARTVSMAGGTVVAQSEESCAVFGMSRAALRSGFVERTLNANEIAAWMLEEVMDDEK